MSERSPLFGVAALAVALLAVGVAVGTGPAPAPTDAQRLDTGDPQPRIADRPNTTNQLMPETAVERQGYTTDGVDVASAVSVGGTRLEGSLQSRTFSERYEAAGSDSAARLAAVRAAVSEAEARVDRLDSRQASLYRAYSNGSLSRSELVDELVRVNARASESRATLQRVRERVESDPTTTLPPTLETRIDETQSHLVVLPTPLTDRLTAAKTGSADPVPVYAGGTEDALVLATVVDGQYRRQATLRSAYEGGGSTNISEAFERITELYPWVYSDGEQFAPTFGPDSSGVGLYRLDATHPQGRLTAYLSGSTSDVFHETQVLDPETVPVSDTVSATNASLNVTVTTTTQTGPMRVELRDRTTGAPLNGTVFVGGDPVATTGDDGTLWTARPVGAFELTVRRGDERVSVPAINFV